jgi:hypothetical protein
MFLLVFNGKDLLGTTEEITTNQIQAMISPVYKKSVLDVSYEILDGTSPILSSKEENPEYSPQKAMLEIVNNLMYQWTTPIGKKCKVDFKTGDEIENKICDFYNKELVSKDTKTHYECDACVTTFDSQEDAIKHVRENHLTYNAKSLVQGDEYCIGVYECSFPYYKPIHIMNTDTNESKEEKIRNGIIKHYINEFTYSEICELCNLENMYKPATLSLIFSELLDEYETYSVSCWSYTGIHVHKKEIEEIAQKYAKIFKELPEKQKLQVLTIWFLQEII